MDKFVLTEVQIKPLLFSAAIVKRYDLTTLPLTFTYEGPNISMISKNFKKIVSSAFEIKEEDIKESFFNLTRGEKEKMSAEYKLNKKIDSFCYYRFEIRISYEADINDNGKFETSIKGSLYFEVPQETSFQRSIFYHFFFSLYWSFYYSKIVEKYVEEGKGYLTKFINLLKAQAKI
ncbi:MAG: hypothetical protein QXW04_01225 [Candidatus Aenigmatarchaeota archaeon]